MRLRNLLTAGVLLTALLVGTQVPLSAQFSAQIQIALQTLGIWPYDGSYSDGNVPTWSAAQNKFLAAAGGGGAITPTSVGVPASTCAAPSIFEQGAATTGFAFTATPTVLTCVGGSAIVTVAAGSVTLAQQLRAASGDNTAPGWSFASDPDTGFFWSGSGLIDLGINATHTMRFQSTGMNFAAAQVIGWSSTSNPAVAADTAFGRTAADLAGPVGGDALGFSSKAWINTAPSGPVACTSPTVTWSNGTATFQIDVGSTCAGISTLVVTLPAVTTAYNCGAMNVTTSATAAVEMTASTTTTATFTNYTRTTGLALTWVDGADVRISCSGG